MDTSKLRSLVYKGLMAGLPVAGTLLYAGLANGLPKSKTEVYSLGIGVGFGFYHAVKNYYEQNIFPTLLPAWIANLIGIPKAP